MTLRTLMFAAAVFSGVFAATAIDAQQRPNAALRIVVIEGEGAVNIIQQKTAVAPVIEVRDRNDQPVAGATVNFMVRAGRATFSGARTLTVTTNAAGRAAAAGFTPSGAGALQIGATATFQGQTAAAVTIAQTNVMTAAQAAAASSAGAGGAGGGGLSTTTLAIVGGAVAGGAIAAKETLLAGDHGITFAADFNGVMPNREVAIPLESNYSCTRIHDQSGTVKITFDSLDAPIQGKMETQIHTRVSPNDCNFTQSYNQDMAPVQASINGTRDKMSAAASHQHTDTITSDVAGTATVTEDYAFTGHFDDDNQISGTLTFERTEIFRGPRYSADQHGSITFQVTLRKQQ
jgi:hypothetical protein